MYRDEFDGVGVLCMLLCCNIGKEGEEADVKSDWRVCAREYFYIRLRHWAADAV